MKMAFQEGGSMGSGTLPAVSVSRSPASGVSTPAKTQARTPVQIPAQRARDVPAPPAVPDEPVAILVAGAAASGKTAVVGALLGVAEPLVEIPPDSYLVIRYGASQQLSAHVPGCRAPHPYRPVAAGEDPGVLIRPPRRVEAEVPDPLLRHFSLVEAPCVHTLGAAGARILADAAERGGAVLFVVAADRSVARAELDLLAELADREIAVFFAVTPPAAGPEPGLVGLDLVAGPHDDSAASGPDLVAAALASHRAEVVARVPLLAGAPWLAVDPAAGDTAFLRRALVEWASVEGLRRAGHGPVAGGTVRIAPDAAESGWSPVLERWLEDNTRFVRQKLAVEVANIHLRCVQDVLFGPGCAALPGALDRELHALSLLATAEGDRAVAEAVDELLGLVLGGEPPAGVRQRVAEAVREGIADDPAADELTRVLLVTSTSGVATVAGEEALRGLPAYQTERAAVLPPVEIGLSGGCYLLWRGQAAADVTKARAWLQRVTRAVELELAQEMSRRLEAVQRSLSGLIAESVDHDILLV